MKHTILIISIAASALTGCMHAQKIRWQQDPGKTYNQMAQDSASCLEYSRKFATIVFTQYGTLQDKGAAYERCMLQNGHKLVEDRSDGPVQPMKDFNNL